MEKLPREVLNLIVDYCDNLWGVSSKIQSMLFSQICSVYGGVTPFTRRIVCWNLNYKSMCHRCQNDIDEAEEAMGMSMQRREEENEYLSINFI